MVRNVSSFIALILLIFTSVTFASTDRRISAGLGAGLIFRTNGANTRMSINSAGSLFLPLFTQDSVLFIGASGEVLESSLLTFDGSTLAFPLADAKIMIGNGSGVAIEQSITGDIGLTNGGLVSISSGVIINDDVNASAAIAHSKMAALTASRAMETNGSGVASPSAVTSTELGQLSGILSSAVGVSDTQTLSNKSFSSDVTLTTQTILRLEDLTGGQGINFQAPTALAATGYPFIWPIDMGTNSQVLTTNGTDTVRWETVSGGGGSPSFATVTKTSSATLATTNEDNVLCDATSGDVTLTLPAATGNNGLTYKITTIHSAANECILDGNASENIDGALTLTLYNQFRSVIITTDGSNWHTVSLDTQGVAYLWDQKADGTSGGSGTTDTFITRDLNQISGDTNFISLASDQFTLTAGDYDIEASAPAKGVSRHQIRLRNITDSTNDLIGTSQVTDASVSDSTVSVISGRISISATKTFEIQHLVQNGGAGSDLGLGHGDTPATVEIYTIVKVTRIR